MIIRCPHCNHEIDIADKDVGTKLYHRACDGWLIVGRQPDGSKYGVKSEPPVSWPKERR